MHPPKDGVQVNPRADGPGSLVWRKSTRSIGNGQCVEVARLADGRMIVRDSVDKPGPVVSFSPGEWGTLLLEIKNHDPGSHGRR